MSTELDPNTRNRSPEVIRALSAFYTPDETAELVAGIAVASGRERILEPSAGSGALVWAALKRSSLLTGAENAKIVACDIDPSAVSRICAVANKNVSAINADFLALDKKSLGAFDLVIANPPFTRNHEIDLPRREWLRNKFGVAGAPGIWVHFLLHAMGFLKNGGGVVSIVPRSILFSDYARSFLEIYKRNFKAVEVLAFRNKIEWDGGASEPGALLVASGFAESLASGAGDLWVGGSLEKSLSSPLDTVVRLGEIASVSIGFVTGKNSLFLMTDKEREDAGIPMEDITPAVTRARHVQGAKLTRSRLLKMAKAGERTLLLTPRRLSPRIKTYLSSVTKEEIESVAWFKKRSPWWRVGVGTPCHAVVTSMNHLAPRIVPVSRGVVCANTLYQLRFRPGVPTDVRQLAIATSYSSFGQLQFERMGRVYGQGLLKLEPSILKSWLVPKSVSGVDPTLLKRLTRLLSEGGDGVAELADQLVLPLIFGAEWRSVAKSLSAELADLRRHRLGESFNGRRARI